MIRVSFYLNSPKAKQSPVYISITKDKDRIRFPSGFTFLTNHISTRNKKGKSFLIKGMPHYFSYDKILKEIEEELINSSIAFDSKNEEYTLIQIKDKFSSKRVKITKEEISFFDYYDQFVTIFSSRWTDGTKKHFETLRNHLVQFEEKILTEKIQIQNVNEKIYRQFRDDYFVEYKKLGNSTSNNYLKKFKQFCEYAVKKEWIQSKVHFDEFKRLIEAETFNIALKRTELESMIDLDLSSNLKLDRVRDLFLLEIYTGQRFSDIPQVLDLSDDIEESINLYQQKTFGKVIIPIHPKLKVLLNNIKEKKYEEITSISLQKFNDYLKEIGKMIGMNRKHHWKTLTGNVLISKSEFRYNLLSSHVGRRSFCTLALKANINPEKILRVTGQSYMQFRKYLKVDEEDMDDAFENFLIK